MSQILIGRAENVLLADGSTISFSILVDPEEIQRVAQRAAQVDKRVGTKFVSRSEFEILSVQPPKRS